MLNMESVDYRNLNDGGRRRDSRVKQFVTLFGLCFLSTCLLGVGVAFYLYVKDHGNDAHGLWDTGPTSVQTPLGTIFGLKKARTTEYLGIPYALPPVGSLRWAPPKEYTRAYPSQGLAAQALKPSCYQITDLSVQPTGIAEDCLYLNVFTPSDRSEPAPVLFFIHGGGGLVGGAAQSVPTLYNGTNLIYSPNLDNYPRSKARDSKGMRNVVVVTINYRLGPFAQLYLNQLVEEDTVYKTAGMYNHLDVQMALKWVSSNIKLFGGDPNRVTVFGESAGANLALTQTVLKGSQGLIHRAISQSGTWGLPMSDSSLAEGVAAGNRFVVAAKCNTQLTSEDTLRCLRAIPAARVLELAASVGTGFNSIRGVIDGKLLTDFPSQLLLNKDVVNKVPVLWGHNRDDSFVPLCPFVPDWFNITEGIYNDRTKLRFEELGVTGQWVNRIIARFPFSSCVVPGNQVLTRSRCCAQLENMTRDYVWICNGRRLFTTYRTASSLPIYNYLFAQTPICPRPPQYGLVDHTEELAYVFGTRSSYLSHGMERDCGWPDEEKDFAYQISDKWSMFARSADPSVTLEWPKYGINETEVYMTLKRDANNVAVLDDITRDRCDSFWDPFSRDLINSQRSL